MIKALSFFILLLFATNSFTQNVPSNPSTESNTLGIAVKEKNNNKSMQTAPLVSTDEQFSFMNVIMVPEKDLIVMQLKNLNTQDFDIALTDSVGKVIDKTTMLQGSTITYFNTEMLYNGDYFIKIANGKDWLVKRVTVSKK